MTNHTVEKSDRELYLALGIYHTCDDRLILTGLADDSAEMQAIARHRIAGEADTTPAAKWREDGEPDPHGDRYNRDRSRLCGGQMTDDELANAVYLEPSLINLTAAKDRIRWLSRELIAVNEKLCKA